MGRAVNGGCVKAAVGLGRILVVDDDAMNRNLFGAVLKKAGFEVSFASRGSEALALTAAEPPDLVLLDYMMPDMNGPEVLARMRKQERMKDVPILLVTASTLEEHIERGLGAGADDYLFKPIDPRILRARVTSALRALDDRRRADVAAAAAVEHGALVAELDEARRIQRAQLPAMPLRWRGWGATGAVVPCGAVGGDLFDVSEGRDGRRVAVLVDVCGHGIAAVLVAAGIGAQLRSLFRSRPLDEAFSLLNERLIEQSSQLYACMAAVELGDHEVTIVNAGLPPVCIGRAGVLRASVQATGVPPGMFPGERYERCTLQVGPGDRIALMSDGVTEPFGVADDVRIAVAGLDLFAASKWGDGDALSADDRLKGWTLAAPNVVRDDATLLLIEAQG